MKVVNPTQYLSQAISLLIANYPLMPSLCQLNFNMHVGGDIHVITAITSDLDSGAKMCHQSAMPVPGAEAIHLMLINLIPFTDFCSSQPAPSLRTTLSFLPRNKPWIWISSIGFQQKWLLQVPDVQEVSLSRRKTSQSSLRDRTLRSENPMPPPLFTVWLHRAWKQWFLGIAKCLQNQPASQFFLPLKGISEDQEPSHCDHGPTSDAMSGIPWGWLDNG